MRAVFTEGGNPRRELQRSKVNEQVKTSKLGSETGRGYTWEETTSV